MIDPEVSAHPLLLFLSHLQRVMSFGLKDYGDVVGRGRRICTACDPPSVSSFPDSTQMNNAVPTSPLLQQMGHPHSYPNLGQISNPYEQQPPGKELNKYASLKAVGKHHFVSFLSPLRFCSFQIFLSNFVVLSFLSF